MVGLRAVWLGFVVARSSPQCQGVTGSKQLSPACPGDHGGRGGEGAGETRRIRVSEDAIVRERANRCTPG